jgi:RimJ/RimL family protein N-acetyltransferase
MIQIQSEHLSLEPVEHRHIDLGWLDWMNDNEILSQISAQKCSRRDLTEYLENAESILFLAVSDRTSGEYIANLRLYLLTDGSLSFGRIIGNFRFRGRGYGQELVRIACDLGLRYLNYPEMIVGNSRSNHASAKSKKRVGFKEISDSEKSSRGLDQGSDFYKLKRADYLKSHSESLQGSSN